MKRTVLVPAIIIVVAVVLVCLGLAGKVMSAEPSPSPRLSRRLAYLWALAGEWWEWLTSSETRRGVNQ